jgi:DNA-binding response OmpR family regulator
LVVDDEPAITNLLRKVLEADGHQVIVASDGQRARPFS